MLQRCLHCSFQKEVKTAEADENLINLNPNSNVKQTVYAYDANGNQITKTAEGKTETNTYDGLNQLIGFNDGETTASYKYNANGLRYEKTVDGQTKLTMSGMAISRLLQM